MKKSSYLLILAFFAVSCSFCNTKNTENYTSRYIVKARDLVAAAKSSTITATQMEAHGKELLSLAIPILTGFKKRHPECKAFLDHVASKAEYMTNLPLEKLEADYHDGEALPQSPEVCYEAKELVVHPATVVALSRQKFNKEGKGQMVDEIQEVLAHIGDLQ